MLFAFSQTQQDSIKPKTMIFNWTNIKKCTLNKWHVFSLFFPVKFRCLVILLLLLLNLIQRYNIAQMCWGTHSLLKISIRHQALPLSHLPLIFWRWRMDRTGLIGPCGLDPVKMFCDWWPGLRLTDKLYWDNKWAGRATAGDGRALFMYLE